MNGPFDKAFFLPRNMRDTLNEMYELCQRVKKLKAGQSITLQNTPAGIFIDTVQRPETIETLMMFLVGENGGGEYQFREHEPTSPPLTDNKSTGAKYGEVYYRTGLCYEMNFREEIFGRDDENPISEANPLLVIGIVKYSANGTPSYWFEHCCAAPAAGSSSGSGSGSGGAGSSAGACVDVIESITGAVIDDDCNLIITTNTVSVQRCDT